ncbi:hypothetical protein H4Q26_015922 [Puccinia striiformis f. sp. tritici PST-130]|nr:hypothetical protein H4Q26_015922 [Puccinia striiformis f. sp. tritici PST-130]
MAPLLAYSLIAAAPTGPPTSMGNLSMDIAMQAKTDTPLAAATLPSPPFRMQSQPSPQDSLLTDADMSNFGGAFPPMPFPNFMAGFPPNNAGNTGFDSSFGNNLPGPAGPSFSFGSNFAGPAASSPPCTLASTTSLVSPTLTTP